MKKLNTLSAIKTGEYIAQKINDMRLARQESYSTFAKNCNLCISTVRHIERAKLDSLNKACNYLGISMLELISEAMTYSRQYDGQISYDLDEKALYIDNIRKGVLARILTYRERKNEDQTEFAQHCGISQHTLYIIENLSSDPKLNTLIKIANYVGGTLQDLFDDESKHIKQDNAINTEKLSMALAMQVKRYRLNKRENVKEFAKNCGVSPITINQIEAGDINRCITIYIRIASYMDISPKKFFSEAENIMLNMI